MEQRKTRDFLIRNMPLEIYHLLEKSAKENHRSKTQEALVVLSHGLSSHTPPIRRPVPFKWKKKITSEFIESAIREGRE